MLLLVQNVVHLCLNNSDIVNHLHKTANAVHQDSSSWLGWLRTTFGVLTYPMLKVMFILLLFIVSLSLFLSCVKKFLFNC